MNAKKIHKKRIVTLFKTKDEPFKLAEALCGIMYVALTDDWDKVTCKKCLKRRKR